MKRVLNADFIISQRTALDLEICKGRKRLAGWALNDALITRGGNPHLIGIEARIGERRLTSYRCDGLIVATPTGSTAYSLAAGGPIISPECNVLTVTPICPQALTNRSVVVNSNEPIEMQLHPTSGPAEVQVDGMKLTKLTPASTITVKRDGNGEAEAAESTSKRSVQSERRAQPRAIAEVGPLQGQKTDSFQYFGPAPGSVR